VSVARRGAQRKGRHGIERLFWICLAGAVGTGTRYLVALWAAQRLGSAFPYGTLIVNLAGCFLIAAMMHAALTFGWSANLRAALTIGFVGGLTTYSSCNFETMRLFEEEAAVLHGLDQKRTEFVRNVGPQLRGALEMWIHANSGQLNLSSFRAGAFDEARRITEKAVSEWLIGIEPAIRALYEKTTKRFVQLANEFVQRVATAADGVAIEPLDPADVQEYERPHFYFASLMHLTGGTARTWVIDRLGGLRARQCHAADAVNRYLDHILDTNSHRVENDIRERTRVSRQQLGAMIRSRLRDVIASAARALRIAHEKQTMAEREIEDRLQQLAAWEVQLRVE
jgi:CrcB protein